MMSGEAFVLALVVIVLLCAVTMRGGRGGGVKIKEYPNGISPRPKAPPPQPPPGTDPHIDSGKGWVNL